MAVEALKRGEVGKVVVRWMPKSEEFEFSEKFCIGFHRQIQGFARPDRRRGPYEHFAGTSSGLEAGKQKKKMHSITPCRKVYRRKGNVRILVGICQRTLIN